jgi:3-oxoadipate enol-lactonase
MPRIDLNGESLHYERAGRGMPLLLIHSLGTSSWLWRAEIAHWSARYDVVAMDARGHGGSSRNGGFGVRAVAEDLAALTVALGLGPAHVVAISMGGPIAAHLVDIAPDRVKSLVIADSFATQGEAGGVRAMAIATSITGASMAQYGRQYASETLVEDSAHVDALAALIASMSAEAYIEAARSVFTADVVAPMRRISVPTLVLCGTRDQRTPPRLSEEIVGLIPGAELQLIEGARHLANLDRPAEFQAAVDGFLAAQG